MWSGRAASLAGIAPDRVRGLLAELTRGHLLTEHRPGRYACHDLLRAYAAEQAQVHDGDNGRQAAVRRLLDHCLHTAHSAATLIDPYFAPVAPAPPGPGVTIGEPATAEEALSWFTAERALLLAAVPLAAQADSAAHAWQLAWALSTFLLRQGHWRNHATACTIGRQMTAHSSLLWIAEQQERYADMLRHAEQVLELSRAAGDPALEVMSLNDIGYTHALLGNYRRAITYCERALAGSQEAGERCWESATWDSLGYIYRQLGHHRRAIACYERSLDLCRELADRLNEAITLDHLGDAHHGTGDLDAARWAWTQALRTFDDIGHPQGDEVRTKLRGSGLLR